VCRTTVNTTGVCFYLLVLVKIFFRLMWASIHGTSCHLRQKCNVPVDLLVCVGADFVFEVPGQSSNGLQEQTVEKTQFVHISVYVIF